MKEYTLSLKWTISQALCVLIIRVLGRTTGKDLQLMKELAWKLPEWELAWNFFEPWEVFMILPLGLFPG